MGKGILIDSKITVILGPETFELVLIHCLQRFEYISYLCLNLCIISLILLDQIPWDALQSFYCLNKGEIIEDMIEHQVIKIWIFLKNNYIKTIA